MESDPSESGGRGPLLRAVLPAVFVWGVAGATGVEAPPLVHAWPLLAATLAVLFLSAALSAAEAALFSLGGEQIDSLERQGRHGVLSARALLAFRDETLTTVLLTDYLLNLILVACLMIGLSHAGFGDPLVAAVGAGLVAIVAVVVFGEFLPRALGRSFNVPVALALARPLVGLTVVVSPLRWLVLALSNALFGRWREELLEHEIGSEEELRTLITASDLNGGLEEDERELITGVVEFGATRVGEIMTPRPDLYAFSIDTAQDEMIRCMRRSEFSRVLIYEDTLDQIRGILHVKDALLNPATDFRAMLRKPLVIPETKGLMDLLREFRRHRMHLAVVCDEFGRTAGVVSMHDLLEEIVGELTDENRPSRENIRQVGHAVWLVPGWTSVEDVRVQVGLEWPETWGRTVSGLVSNRLGRIPAVGDSIEENGFRLQVERMGVRRVSLLRIEKVAAAPLEAEESEAP